LLSKKRNLQRTETLVVAKVLKKLHESVFFSKKMQFLLKICQFRRKKDAIIYF